LLLPVFYLQGAREAGGKAPDKPGSRPRPRPGPPDRNPQQGTKCAGNPIPDSVRSTALFVFPLNGDE
jgi:hypothetical protein